jgi:hypothetical protein
MKSILDHLKDKYNLTGRYFNEMPYATRKKDQKKYEAYNKRQAEIELDFVADLEKEFGTDVYPKRVRELIFSKAWQEGHSYGHGEVLNCYGDLAEFVDDILSVIMEVENG